MADMITIADKVVKTLVCATLLLISSTGYANRNTTIAPAMVCDSQSPSLLQLGERYYYLAPDPASVTGKDVARLENLYARLQGRWKGNWTDQYCAGSGKSAKLRSNSREFQQVQANIREHGQLSFRADGLSIDLAAGRELISLDIIDDNTLKMTLRYQRGTAPPYYQPRQAALRERHDTLSLIGKELRLETRWFINGFYSGTELTTLSRVR